MRRIVRRYLLSFALALAAAFGTAAEVGANGLSPPSAYPAQLGGRGDNPYTVMTGGNGQAVCTRDQGLPNYWVNTDTLNLVVQDTDFRYQGLGPEVAVTRTYNLDPAQKGMFGNGWSSTYETRLVQSNGLTGTVTLTKGSGQRLAYAYGSSSTAGGTQTTVYTPPAGIYDTLSAYTTGAVTYYLYRAKDTKLVYRYDPDPTLAARLHLSSIGDRNGNALALAYNADGTLASLTDAAGRQTRFAYNGQKLCSTMTTPDGGTVSYSYDAAGNLTGNVDLIGTAIGYTFYAPELMTGVTAQLMSSVTAGGKTIAFSYKNVGYGKRLGTVTDADGFVTVYEGGVIYGRVSSRQTPDGYALYVSANARTTGIYYYNTLNEGYTQGRMTYNASGLPVQRTDANSNTAAFAWDAHGNLTEYTDPTGAVTRFAYDGDDNLSTVTTPLNEIWSYGHDAKGNLTSTTSPGGNKTTLTYDARGNLLTVVDANLKTTSLAYDAARFYNPATVTDATGESFAFGYDAAGINLTAVTDPNHYTMSFAYDRNRRPTRTTFPDGAVRSYDYDALAPIAVTDENGATTRVARDGRLNAVKLTDALGQEYRRSFDHLGNLVSSADPLGHAGTYTYDYSTNDYLQRPATATDALGGVVRLTRDANGNVTVLADELGKASRFTYDQRNRIKKAVDPLAKAVTTTYDALGRRSLVTNARGGTVGFAYDSDGRLVSRSYGGASVATYTYDAVGNLLAVTDAGGTTAFAYDAANRVTGIAYPDGKALSQTWDAGGNLQTQGYAGGLLVTYSYDSRNRIVRVAWGSHLVDFGYDAAGNLLTETRSSGVTSRYGYDAAGRMTAVAHKKGAITIADITYTRDAAGRISAEDGVRPLLPAFFSGTASGSYDDANGIATWNGDGYTYDADGNLTAIAGSRTFSASYDPENRPVSIVKSGSTTSYAYDGLGRRVKAQAAGATRNFHHDPRGRLLFETDGSGQVTATYVHAEERIVASATGGGSAVFHHRDKTGSTLALTDAAGAVVGAFAYAPYGELSGSSGTATTPFKYVGAYGVMDEGDGLYFMKNRYYDAATGRFLQKDPIGFAGGLNLYGYVGGNPVDRIDPEGQFVYFLLGGAMAAMLATAPYFMAKGFGAVNEEEISLVEKLAKGYELNIKALLNKKFGDKLGEKIKCLGLSIKRDETAFVGDAGDDKNMAKSEAKDKIMTEMKNELLNYTTPIPWWAR